MQHDAACGTPNPLVRHYMKRLLPPLLLLSASMAYGQWTGVTAAMWAEINAQRALFGDQNDCQARIASLPTSGGKTIGPGADIAEMLRSNAVVFLTAGVYRLTDGKNLVVPAGKKLIGI